MRRDPTIRTPVLLLALMAIAVLAIGLPFGAVQWLHGRRLRTADAEIAELATRLTVSGWRDAFPDSVGVLMGPGDTPRTADGRWVTGTTAPLSRVSVGVEPDPWGNAYMVNLAARHDREAAVWVLSAGPNGIIETDFAHASSPAGDDIAVRVR